MVQLGYARKTELTRALQGQAVTAETRGGAVLEGVLKVESELRRQGQELAVAWRRGRASFVLSTLAAETPMRSAVLSALIQELLSRWDPLDGKWSVGFWRALVLKSEGWTTSEEIDELTALYRRRFGMSPPRTPNGRKQARTSEEYKKFLETRATSIKEALDAGEPIPKSSHIPASHPTEFLRSRRAAL